MIDENIITRNIIMNQCCVLIDIHDPRDDLFTITLYFIHKVTHSFIFSFDHEFSFTSA